MRKKALAFSTVAALGMVPFMGLPAWANPCVTAPVATYTAAGFSCNVDGFTFSNIVVTPHVSFGGQVTLGNFSPYQQDGEFGLTLDYTALAQTPNSTADITWTYNVVGVPFIGDAFLAFVGNTSGSGQAVVSETLSNGVVLSLNAPGSTTATFTPVSSLGVLKDQLDFVGLTPGFSTTSALTNAFSVPGPTAGAGLPGLLAACSGLIFLGRRRQRKLA